MAGIILEKKKIPPKPQPVQIGKKKKNAPDAPQPKWLFPPDEENPVLNPKAKTEEDMKKEKEERKKSLEFMKRRVHAAPDRPAPPHELLTLVGVFLTDFGFNSTSRLFTNERNARKELNGWDDEIGKKKEKGTPTLEEIYRDWHRDWKIKQKDDTSSSESGSESSDSESDAGVITQRVGQDSSDDDSEASSDGLGGSDVEMKDSPNLKSKAKKGKTAKKASSPSSSSSSTSDSDADDEDEQKPKSKLASSTKKGVPRPISEASKPTVGAMINNLKRKPQSSDSDSSSSGSESSKEEQPAKKAKRSAVTTIVAASLPNGVSDSESESASASSSSSESEEEIKVTKPAIAKITAQSGSDSNETSESSESDSLEEEEKSKKPSKSVNGVPTLPAAASDSSTTLNGETKKVNSISDSESSSSSATSSSEAEEVVVKKEVTKKRHQGAKPTPLAELSAKGIDSHISNQYQSYEYADRAYKDLSVTRGKGFTKEKNKKKRGSYRGGAIDTSGGRAVKFED